MRQPHLVAMTSVTPSSIVSSETSNVPPPRSKTRTLRSFLLDSLRPYLLHRINEGEIGIPAQMSIRDGGGGGLVDDALDTQPGDGACSDTF